jgi:competence protein ComEA
VNLSAKKSWFILLSAASVLLVIILVWRFGQGGAKAVQMGFTPVNEQMRQIIDETTEHGSSANAGISQRGSKPSVTPNAVKGPAEDHPGSVSSSSSNQSTNEPSKGISTSQPSKPPKSSESNLNQAVKPAANSSSPQKGDSEINGRLDLNKATIEQLDALPGIGESKAKAILAYRSEKGSFKKVEQLLEVKGIGEKLLAKIKPMVYTSEP